MKRKITPHKGGRTDYHVRLTEMEKKRIREKAKRLRMSQADLIIAAVYSYEGGGKPPKLTGKTGK